MKCTSCGATTPGGPDDKWNSDFSLCASCEALRLKGVLLISIKQEKGGQVMCDGVECTDCYVIGQVGENLNNPTSGNL